MKDGIAVIGAGRIGVPWAAVLSVELSETVTCIDVDPDRVDTINRGEAPFQEPQLESYIETGVAEGTLSATTDPSVISDHQYVAITVNAPRNRMEEFLDVIREYAEFIDDDHVIINRTTIPVDVVTKMEATIADSAASDPTFTVFPERLAEGKAIEEIKTLPKIVGVSDERGKDQMTELLAGLECDIEFTDPETTMFVKLIDNSYRDALFAIANQIAFTADQLDLDAHTAISLANREYPRNDIPTPGTVGGKCLPKDPHFLMDSRVCEQPTTPDLFSATRRTNSSIPAYVVTEILRQQPTAVAVLGTSYKGGVGDTYNSPAKRIADDLQAQGIAVSAYDPYVTTDATLEETLSGADTVILAVNHPEFDGIEPTINETVASDAIVYDLWGMLEETRLERPYEGFGIAPKPNADRS
ncbi:nucleotide sugar dehydrogenase [Natrarchaeobius chitinivorans]|uniref:UDP-N-acetyl-D-mannosamine dehydrogenase n=1 Tax=Natrarchaeobius chitinivorans TaxID=1679083 RepID=A0A3N6LWI6_NATCH|nr:nucleotide sugar dehydrogenase [Natrarchaeobius chitinivorans]RQG92054.1 nucleotide sugar dehydrogenase [Natrarchaeobius chitinivorans]